MAELNLEDLGIFLQLDLTLTNQHSQLVLEGLDLAVRGTVSLRDSRRCACEPSATTSCKPTPAAEARAGATVGPAK